MARKIVITCLAGLILIVVTSWAVGILTGTPLPDSTHIHKTGAFRAGGVMYVTTEVNQKLALLGRIAGGLIVIMTLTVLIKVRKNQPL